MPSARPICGRISLPDTLRDEARNSLREYLVLRTGGAPALVTAEGMARSPALHDRLWAIATNAATITDTVSSGLFAQSLDDVIDLDTIRVTMNRNRMTVAFTTAITLIADLDCSQSGLLQVSQQP